MALFQIGFLALTSKPLQVISQVDSHQQILCVVLRSISLTTSQLSRKQPIKSHHQSYYSLSQHSIDIQTLALHYPNEQLPLSKAKQQSIIHHLALYPFYHFEQALLYKRDSCWGGILRDLRLYKRKALNQLRIIGRRFYICINIHHIIIAIILWSKLFAH